MSGDSQMSGLRLQRLIITTATGNSKLAGKAGSEELRYRLDAHLGHRGRRPIMTPSGTQMSDASAISTMTRINVKVASIATCRISAHSMLVEKNTARCLSATRPASPSNVYHR